MSRRGVAFGLFACMLLQAESGAGAVGYDRDEMAPIGAYLMDSAAEEIALARSAAPAHISDDATVLVLQDTGYTTAYEGSNGFVCLVERSWGGQLHYVGEFWDPAIRAPNCYNAEGARSALPMYMLRTRLVLEGEGRAQIGARLDHAIANGDLSAPTGAAMSYMMSGGQYLHPDVGRWLPHIMIWMPYTAQDDWGRGAITGLDPVVFRNPGGPFAMVVIPYGEDRFIDPAPVK